MLYTIVTAFIIVFICSIGVVFLLDSKLTKPLIKITKHSKQLGELDISKNVEEVYLLQKDEIGTLSNTFQVLTVNLRKIITELSGTAVQVLDTAHKLTETTQQSADTSDCITRNIGEIARSTYEQAKSTETGLIHASMLDEKIRTNHSHMINLNTATIQVLKLVDEGLITIDKLVLLTEDNDAATQKIFRVIQEMQKSSEQIGVASKIISEIARETNLLSLNASIEAARAGEAGRSFAVVAGEILNLADQSASSTKVIDSVIAQLHNNMHETVESMSRMIVVSKEQNQSIAETICKYKEISDAIKNSEKAVSELNYSEKEMEKANCEITNMLQALSSIAEQNAAGTQQSVSAMEDQNASVQIIADVSNRLTQLAISLKTTVSNFKLS
jgi:methyl-accepting chemotaxis protein